MLAQNLYTMKKTAIFLASGLALLASIQLTSCKKDKKEEPKTMIGKWSIVKAESKETTNGTVTGTTTLELGGLYGIEFKADKSYRRFTPLDPTSDENGTYETSGSRLILNYKDAGVSVSDTSEYEFSEDTFIMKTTDTDVDGTDTIVTEDKETYKRS